MCSPSPPVLSPLDAEDLLREILLRLPPQPSSLPRASLVCKRWRSILSDPDFLKCFCKHHRKPPLLGFFENQHGRRTILTPLLDPPDRIPAASFTLPQKRSSYNYESCYFMSCCHGLAVLVYWPQREIVVWDPLTSHQKCVCFPQGLYDDKEYMSGFFHATVMRDESENGHLHGSCFSNPFKLLFFCCVQHIIFTCIYESTSGVWGNIVSIPFTDMVYRTGFSVFVRNTIYWLLSKGDVCAIDFERKNFSVFETPAEAHVTEYQSAQLLRTEDGGLGLAVLSELTIKLWERKSNYDGVVKWLLLQKIIHLDLFPCTIPNDCKTVLIVGYDDDSNVIVLSTIIGNFVLQLDSAEIRHIVKRDAICYNTIYPYTRFYSAGMQDKDSRRSLPFWLSCFGHLRCNGREKSKQSST